jgi:hypothetical protein
LAQYMASNQQAKGLKGSVAVQLSASICNYTASIEYIRRAINHGNPQVNYLFVTILTPHRGPRPS